MMPPPRHVKVHTDPSGEFRGTIAELERKGRRYGGDIHFVPGVRVTRMTRVFVDSSGRLYAGPDTQDRYTHIGQCELLKER